MSFLEDVTQPPVNNHNLVNSKVCMPEPESIANH